MVCKGICSRHQAMRPSTGMRYLIGQKRCQVCQIFINWQGWFCPCCGYKLRTKPRNKKYKQQLVLSNNIKNNNKNKNNKVKRVESLNNLLE